MAKIYTKTGDKGKTGLIGGTRVDKSSLIIDALGSIDEISANIGILKNFLDSEDAKIKEFLQNMQKDFLTIGAVIAGADIEFDIYKKVLEFENQIDKIHEDLEPLKTFLILGDNNIKEAQAHMCRVVTRRAERLLVKYNQNSPYVAYFNRLSDYFFALARYFK